LNATQNLTQNLTDSLTQNLTDNLAQALSQKALMQVSERVEIERVVSEIDGAQYLGYVAFAFPL